ncbi:MAG: hypothetical protein JJV98_09790 [Desulfosarcina sp.]|nr:hypothetical protein [Desulfobacterales bacterium]
MNAKIKSFVLSIVLSLTVAAYPAAVGAFSEIFELPESGTVIVFEREGCATFAALEPTCFEATGALQRQARTAAPPAYELPESGLVITFTSPADALSTAGTPGLQAHTTTWIHQENRTCAAPVSVFEHCESGALIEFYQTSLPLGEESH